MSYNSCMITTINISLPKSLLVAAKAESKKFGFASVSEYIRQAVRTHVYGLDKNGLTVNGFTPEFEDMVLEAEKEPIENDIVLETDKDVDDYFRSLRPKGKMKRANDKSITKGQLRTNVSRFASL